jgi:pyrroline-5-carboxylate reductase
LGGFEGALGAFSTVAELEQALVNQGLSIEAARSAAQSASAGAGSQLAASGRQATSGGGLFNSLLGRAAMAFATQGGSEVARAVFKKDDEGGTP